MKKAVIVALVCVNVALLLTLIWQMSPSATAQDDAAYYSPTNYIMVAGQIESGYELVYIIDMATRGLSVIQYDLSAPRDGNQLIPFAHRDLASDFRDSR